MTTIDTIASTSCCSFCGKPAPEVHKIIAGPGVCICDECVQKCNGILDEDRTAEESSSEPRIPAWENMTDQQVLENLPRIARVAAQVDASLQQWVTHLRERGVTWSRIGGALGMTRQSAWERFSGEE